MSSAERLGSMVGRPWCWKRSLSILNISLNIIVHINVNSVWFLLPEAYSLNLSKASFKLLNSWSLLRNLLNISWRGVVNNIIFNRGLFTLWTLRSLSSSLFPFAWTRLTRRRKSLLRLFHLLHLRHIGSIIWCVNEVKCIFSEVFLLKKSLFLRP